MFKTLYGKLSAVLLLLFLGIGILFVLLTLFTTRGHLQEMNQKLNRSLAGHIASETPLIKDARVDEGAIREIFHMLMVVNPGIEVYLLGKDGSILSYSAPPGKVKRTRVSLAPLVEFLKGTKAFPIFGDDPRDPRKRKIFSVAPVPPAGPAEGYLYVILGGEEYDTVSRMLHGSYIAQLGVGAVGGGVLFALLAGLFLFYRLTYRHRSLAKAVESFQQSGFSNYPEILGRFSVGKGDEIERLGATFAQMAGRIDQQIRDLRDADRLRRELVTHVSHDLRTPLTSLQGYLETLSLKEGELSAGEQIGVSRRRLAPLSPALHAGLGAVRTRRARFPGWHDPARTVFAGRPRPGRAPEIPARRGGEEDPSFDRHRGRDSRSPSAISA